MALALSHLSLCEYGNELILKPAFVKKYRDIFDFGCSSYHTAYKTNETGWRM